MEGIIIYSPQHWQLLNEPPGGNSCSILVNSKYKKEITIIINKYYNSFFLPTCFTQAWLCNCLLEIKKPCDSEVMIGSLILAQGPFPLHSSFALMVTLTSRDDQGIPLPGLPGPYHMRHLLLLCSLLYLVANLVSTYYGPNYVLPPKFIYWSPNP